MTSALTYGRTNADRLKTTRSSRSRWFGSGVSFATGAATSAPAARGGSCGLGMHVRARHLEGSLITACWLEPDLSSLPEAQGLPAQCSQEAEEPGRSRPSSRLCRP
jgi:hypothetical protein